MTGVRRDFTIGWMLAAVTVATLVAASWAYSHGLWLLLLVVCLAGSFPWLLVVFLVALVALDAARGLLAVRRGIMAEPIHELADDYVDGRIDASELERRIERVLGARRGT